MTKDKRKLVRLGFLLFGILASSLGSGPVSLQAFTDECYMTGGGVLICSQDETTRVTYGFELHGGPVPIRTPNNLQINWKGNRFHLETLTQSTCFDDPAIDPAPPRATFDTLWIRGTGRYNGVSGYTITACFIDAGEPSDNDEVAFVIHDPDGKEVLVCGGKLKGGNNQAHDR